MIKLWDSIDRDKRKRGRKSQRKDILARGYFCVFIKKKGTNWSTLSYHFTSKHGCKLHTHPLQSLQRWLNSHSTTIRKYRLRNK